VVGYLDAGSGSIIASAAAAGFAGAAVAARMGWQRMTGRFKKQDAAAEEELAEPAADS
jgi:hypothetical protein